jgi:tetratricopeptide (TPR) repeat protein
MKFPLLSLVLLLASLQWSMGQTMQTTPDGIAYAVIEAGSGASPAEGLEMSVHNTIYDVNGNKVMSTREMGSPWHILMDMTGDENEDNMTRAAFVMKEGGTYRFKFPKEMVDIEMVEDLPGDHVFFEVELLSVQAPKPSAAKLLMELGQKEGPEAMMKRYSELSRSNPEGYTMRESDFNQAGYQLMASEHMEEAGVMFMLNSRLHPQSANVYDSLGDYHAAQGETERAKASYEHALKLNPNFTASQQKLEKLGQ